MPKSKERWKRWSVFLLSLFFMGNGIAMVTNAQLGTTPISSVPYEIARILDITLGTSTLLINVVLLFAQMLLLSELFRPKYFLQLPCVLVFSGFIDLGLWLTHNIIPECWGMRLLMCLAGCLIMALGIMLEVTCNTTVIPGEGFVLALACRTKHTFANLKIINDIALVIIAALLSFFFLGRIEGLREGTVLVALFTGRFVRFFERLLRPRIDDWFRR